MYIRIETECAAVAEVDLWWVYFTLYHILYACDIPDGM